MAGAPAPCLRVGDQAIPRILLKAKPAMCGIVGLPVKAPAFRGQLGQRMAPIMIGMTERGPASAGLAVFTPPLAGARKKISVFAGDIDGGEHYDWQALVD